MTVILALPKTCHQLRRVADSLLTDDSSLEQLVDDLRVVLDCRPHYVSVRRITEWLDPGEWTHTVRWYLR